MKYYSDIVNKVFDSEEECVNAEKEFNEKKEAAEAERKAKAALVSKEKKELSDAVEAAESKLSKAYEEYDLAKEEVKKILEESNQKALDILNPAKEAIREAQKERYTAISEFNKKYGIYTAQYTGDRAFKEFKRATNWIEDFFNRFTW